MSLTDISGNILKEYKVLQHMCQRIPLEDLCGLSRLFLYTLFNRQHEILLFHYLSHCDAMFNVFRYGFLNHLKEATAGGINKRMSYLGV